MADSVDIVGADSIRNMKVADLKRELKARGLSTAGNKSELAERLEAALGLPKADMSDVQLDEGLDQGVDVNEDEALLEESLLLPTEGKANNGDVFAREEELLATPVTKEPPAAAQLNLDASNLTAPSIAAAAAPVATQQKIAVTPTAMEPASNESEAKKVRLKVTSLSEGDATAATTGAPKVPTKELSVEERISLRSKKFNMPLSDTARLKVRMERFGAAAQNSPAASKDTTKTSAVKLSRTSISANPPPVDLAKLKKRAERFGQSVSTVAKDLEEKERLLKRKQRFNSTPAPDASKKAKTITT
ncbi:SAP domain-containing ribonucleoprotein isoform X1 [Dermacentor silvarum]|uniref:SAP domain-containing ribonucleoprotein isoform X1 n=1 Tax=Dermacentor silvarum TaxID=543639 RepID=UPI001898B4FE|nr:SAP domain-containing ribonucleoprotein isoform X1 [Dermacentor silvarum]